MGERERKMKTRGREGGKGGEGEIARSASLFWQEAEHYPLTCIRVIGH